MLKVKKLDPRAILPTVAHPGEDLAYDLYALEDTVIRYGSPTKVRTGIAAQAYFYQVAEYGDSGGIKEKTGYLPHVAGLLIRDRSSVVSRGLIISGGVIDAGYTGEISVLMTAINPIDTFTIKAGYKFAQMIPIPVLTGEVVEVQELRESSRGEKGFGSSGK